MIGCCASRYLADHLTPASEVTPRLRHVPPPAYILPRCRLNMTSLFNYWSDSLELIIPDELEMRRVVLTVLNSFVRRSSCLVSGGAENAELDNTAPYSKGGQRET